MLWVGMMIPYRVAFNTEDTSFLNVMLDFYIDFVFFIDIMITFITPFLSKRGNFVFDHKRIR